MVNSERNVALHQDFFHPFLKENEIDTENNWIGYLEKRIYPIF